MFSFGPIAATKVLKDELALSMPMFVVDRAVAKELYHVKRVPVLFFVERQREIVKIAAALWNEDSLSLALDAFKRRQWK